MNSSKATCYYNDGSVAKNDYFCGFPNQDTCCGFGWECLSNGLCRYSGTSKYAIGSCADFSLQNCPSFCNDATPLRSIVRRCEPAGNSWCFECHLQKLTRGLGCCNTTLTTSLAPYPFTIRTPNQSTGDSSSTTSIPSVTELTSTPSSSSYLGASLESIREASIETSTQSSNTPSGALPSSPLTQPANQSYNSKMDINVGITVAVVAILLAVLAFFIFQNRNFRQRLLQKREGPSGQEGTRPAVRRGNENPPGELDITHYELPQQNAPQHELSGNEIHELYYRGIPQHPLNRDGSQR